MRGSHHGRVTSAPRHFRMLDHVGAVASRVDVERGATIHAHQRGVEVCRNFLGALKRSQGLKPELFFRFTARLKSCPDTKQEVVGGGGEKL
jgi:hypothetical protein